MKQKKLHCSLTLLCLICLSVSHALPRVAQNCQTESCSIANNCRCSSKLSPLSLEETPQLISLTFDEAVLEELYTGLWEPLLFNRKNPDGNPISGTFFVPHEYTDYSRVQDLYVRGFEIGVNSITKNGSSEYWAYATEETLVNEFGGQRIVVSTFAKIPIEDIVGARTPLLQIEGDILIDAYVASGIKYDNSWTSRSTDRFFPYTLDYLSSQECRTDTSCPKESHPGFWIVPINNIQGNDSIECNALNACNFQGTADEIASWLFNQVETIRVNSKTPLTLMVPSAWFRFVANSYQAFEIFLDALGRLNDVFLVSQKQVVDWIKNPVPVSEFRTEVTSRTADCINVRCNLFTTTNEVRYMTSCTAPCPDVYPWLGNPLGQRY